MFYFYVRKGSNTKTTQSTKLVIYCQFVLEELAPSVFLIQGLPKSEASLPLADFAAAKQL